MENQRLDEIVVQLAERTGSSIEDCAIMIHNIIAVGESIEIAIKQIADVAIQVWDTIKESFAQCQENEAIHGWHIDWDTRKKSQMVNNRPSFAVRKFISVR